MNIVKITDGLGNQMFQYAFARKLEMVTGKEIYLDTRFINNEDVVKRKEQKWSSKKNSIRKYGLEYFNITLQIADDNKLKKWKYLTDESYFSKISYQLAKLNILPWRYCDEELGNILYSKLFPTYYKGYFFNLNYYDDIKHILQREFVIKDKIKLPNFLKEVLKHGNTVSVHIRRGDFLKLNRDISQKEYYPKALLYIEKNIKNPIYLVFSDDIKWAKNNLIIKGEVIYIGELGFDDYQELTIMKHCKNNIIANSTFSYWGAYLNNNPNKIVICPKGWKKEIIPKEWVKL